MSNNDTSNPENISVFEPINIGGIRQWISIKSQNIENPIILYLHGGPGSPLIPVVNHFNAALEKHFILVQWEQRGSGKSYDKSIDKNTMTIDQFVSDLHEVIAFLKDKFGKEKVYMIGHSWGSALGMLYINEYPNDCYAYIGTGQAININEAEKISYEYTFQMALKNNNKKALRELKQIGTPPYSGKNDKVIFKKYTTQRKWLTEFGGQFYDKKNKNVGMKLLMSFKGYSFKDKMNYMEGLKFSQTTVGKKYLNLNLFDEVKKVDVPIYFLIGKMDYTTPFVLVQKYVDFIQAPYKEIIWFEKSSHSPMFEEPDAFNDTLIHKILKETMGR
jgi:pimeloyl-ACP methyl ester carboxylesterase